MKLSNISIVLVRPIQPGNVGSVVRAMKNSGLRHLVLVDPCDIESDDAKKMAIGDTQILGNAKIYTSLKEALQRFTWTVATTRRVRRRFDSMLTPKGVAEKIKSLPDRARIAVVFGPEDRGLENAELALCQAVSTIPSHPKFPSMNLAQAVMVHAYEIYCKSLSKSKTSSKDLASVKELEGMYGHLKMALTRIGFFNRGKPETLMESIINFVGRSDLSPRDVRIMRGICATILRQLTNLKP